ncbi:Auxin transport protein (BIG) isoform 1 [Dorcoceras hygrometricum]|uniref:Auxin transport protein (BIG) isoform 1 n=1 Tax=Dorcoceras hygrometricum TaxID=472368 RepID=A0A2Z7B874_9LAMI|nr:Auxin transport protein (BIG) isoform 1 [Dorcoceras hygrometricum]
MNSKQSLSRCLLFLSLKPAATTSRSIHEKTSQNDTIPTNLNDIVALHQLVHLSLATQPKAGTRSLQANTNGWSREINQNDDALTNPNDIVKVTSASLPPAGSPVATHHSQQPLAAGSIRNTQNAAFQLNETTSLHFYDWFPKPAAGHSKLTHLLIQQSITPKMLTNTCRSLDHSRAKSHAYQQQPLRSNDNDHPFRFINPADNSAVNSDSAQSADNSEDNSAANSAVNSAVNSVVNSALTNENSAFGDENPDLAHEFQQLLHAYSDNLKAYCPEPIAIAPFLRIRSPPSRIVFPMFLILDSIREICSSCPSLRNGFTFSRKMILTVQKLFHHVSHTLFKFHLDPKPTNLELNPRVPYTEDAYEISVIFISMQRPKISIFVIHFK